MVASWRKTGGDLKRGSGSSAWFSKSGTAGFGCGTPVPGDHEANRSSGRHPWRCGAPTEKQGEGSGGEKREEHMRKGEEEKRGKARWAWEEKVAGGGMMRHWRRGRGRSVRGRSLGAALVQELSYE